MIYIIIINPIYKITIINPIIYNIYIITKNKPINYTINIIKTIILYTTPNNIY